MPSTILNARNSFVIFNEGKHLHKNNCYAEPVNKCIPVKDLRDIQFQFYMPFIDKPTGLAKFYIIPVTFETFNDELCGEMPFEFLKIGNPNLGCLNGQVFPETFAEFEPILDAEPYNLANIMVGDWNKIDLPNLIKEGDCFRFIIVQSDLSSIEGCVDKSWYIGCSNCFWRMPESEDTCDTSVIFYRNNENSFDFNYQDKVSSLTPNFINIVRLPFYLYAPQYASDVNGYQKSDGTYLKLSERINESWQLKTDYFTKEWHERLKIALAHDDVAIQNDNAGLAIQAYSDEEYNIEWNEDERMIDATAQTNVKRSTSLNRVNSNCK